MSHPRRALGLDAGTDILVAAVEMGYGHLRAARPLSDALGCNMVRVDQPPVADELEGRPWRMLRAAQEVVSQLSQRTGPLAAPMQAVLDAATTIAPLHPFRDLSHPGLAVRALELLARRGLGQGLLRHLQRTDSTLLTTFYAPAVIADLAGREGIYCVVTDADIHRVWVPPRGRDTRIHYFAPSRRVVRRLEAYGVPPRRITYTGFPLPGELLGGPDLEFLRRDVAGRIVRLDPERSFRSVAGSEVERLLGPLPHEEAHRPPLLTFAVGGAGAQAELAFRFLPRFRTALRRGRFRLALVAGIRPDVAAVFERALASSGLDDLPRESIRIVLEEDFDAYYSRFNALMRETDILWTKPSELCFYAALGIPLVLGQPVGMHEHFNRRWLREHGIGLKQREPRFAIDWLDEWLGDGALAAAAWSGYVRLPKLATYRIVEHLRTAGVGRVDGPTPASRLS